MGKGGGEGGGGRKAGAPRESRHDAGEIVRQVQRRERDQLSQPGLKRGRHEEWAVTGIAAMDDAMSDGPQPVAR